MDDEHSPVLIPTNYITNIHVSVSGAVEVTVILGRLHMASDPNSNNILPTPRIEWFQSLALNPIIAKQLHLGLDRAIKFYENEYGKIPEDPGFKSTVV